MANRPATILALMPAVSALTTSTNLGGAYDKAQINNSIVSENGWLTANPRVFPEWIKYDFGSAKTFDTFLIGCSGYGANANIKAGTIDYSADDSSWTTAYTFADLFASAATTTKYVIGTFAPQTARYWRINITNNYGDANYVGCNEWMLWDSTLIGSAVDSGATLAGIAETLVTLSASELTNRSFAANGLYMQLPTAGKWSEVTIDLGSSQYVGGLAVQPYGSSGYYPTTLRLYTSTDGLAWTYQETLSPSAWVAGKLLAITFSRIYLARYYKLNMLRADGVSYWFWYEWFINATLTPATPAVPTSLLVTGDSDDSTSLQLRWSQAAGDDNVVADLKWDVQRQKDGVGGFSTVATVVAPSAGLQEYIDTGLAAGSYEYKVRAVGKYHAVASAYTAASTAITIPIAAGGGVPGFASSLIRAAKT